MHVVAVHAWNWLYQLYSYNLSTFHITLQADESDDCIGFESLQESQKLLEISESIPDEVITIPTLVVQGSYIVQT